jgi:hypothetical protein
VKSAQPMGSPSLAEMAVRNAEKTLKAHKADNGVLNVINAVSRIEGIKRGLVPGVPVPTSEDWTGFANFMRDADFVGMLRSIPIKEREGTIHALYTAARELSTRCPIPSHLATLIRETERLRVLDSNMTRHPALTADEYVWKWDQNARTTLNTVRQRLDNTQQELSREKRGRGRGDVIRGLITEINDCKAAITREEKTIAALKDVKKVAADIPAQQIIAWIRAGVDMVTIMGAIYTRGAIVVDPATAIDSISNAAAAAERAAEAAAQKVSTDLFSQLISEGQATLEQALEACPHASANDFQDAVAYFARKTHAGENAEHMWGSDIVMNADGEAVKPSLLRKDPKPQDLEEKEREVKTKMEVGGASKSGDGAGVRRTSPPKAQTRYTTADDQLMTLPQKEATVSASERLGVDSVTTSKPSRLKTIFRSLVKTFTKADPDDLEPKLFDVADTRHRTDTALNTSARAQLLAKRAHVLAHRERVDKLQAEAHKPVPPFELNARLNEDLQFEADLAAVNAAEPLDTPPEQANPTYTGFATDLHPAPAPWTTGLDESVFRADEERKTPPTRPRGSTAHAPPTAHLPQPTDSTAPPLTAQIETAMNAPEVSSVLVRRDGDIAIDQASSRVVRDHITLHTLARGSSFSNTNPPDAAAAASHFGNAGAFGLLSDLKQVPLPTTIEMDPTARPVPLESGPPVTFQLGPSDVGRSLTQLSVLQGAAFVSTVGSANAQTSSTTNSAPAPSSPAPAPSSGS